MCNFNKHDDDTKLLMHSLVQKCAHSLGGTNFLLNLSEAIREKKPTALILSACKLESKELYIKWNKIIFKDKFETLEEAIRLQKDSQEREFNILSVENEKKKKKILNMVKTLLPIEFTITSKNASETSFTFKIFESVDLEQEMKKLNPIFVALFLCSTEYLKKAAKFEAKPISEAV